MNKHNCSFLDERKIVHYYTWQLLFCLVQAFFTWFEFRALGEDFRLFSQLKWLISLQYLICFYFYLDFNFFTREYTRSIPALEYDFINTKASIIEKNNKISSYFQLGFSCDKDGSILYQYDIHHDPNI